MTMDLDLRQVAHMLELSFVPGPQQKQASDELLKLQDVPNYLGVLAQILRAEGVNPIIQQAAAVHFKNTVREKWAGGQESPIPAPVRAEVKANLLDLMLSSQAQVQRQLREAIKIVSESDFPGDWKELLPQLVQRFGSGDLGVINGCLRTASAILKRYRHQFKEESVLLELKFILEQFQDPLLQLFTTVVTRVREAGSNAGADVLVPYFAALNSMVKIFFSLCSVDLPEHFENHREEWMSMFQYLFTYETNLSDLLENPDNEDKPGLLFKLYTNMCECLNLWNDKYDAEFRPFAADFAQVVWGLLMKIGHQQCTAMLATHAIAYLTSISRSIHYELYNNEDILKKICEEVVVPNMILTDNDLENFEDNPVEYIRRDVEGSDTETRRRSAFGLVKGLRKHYEAQVTAILASYVNGMLEAYKADPSNQWKQKDVCSYLVTALAVTNTSASQGAHTTNQLVPILDFYQNAILPDLQSFPEGMPVLQADALKFTITFRRQLPAEYFPPLLELITAMLGSPVFVVNTYAAIAIEKLLTVRDNGVLRAGEAFKKYMGGMLKALFAIVTTKQATGISGARHNITENEYAMKCIMRILHLAGKDALPLSTICIAELAKILAEAAKSPQNPSFSHYLFESLAISVKCLAGGKPDAVPAVEQLLLPTFQQILVQDITEFSTYTFQIMALLLELHSGSVSPAYQQLFPQLLTPELWRRSGNIPGLVRILQAYIKKTRGSSDVVKYLEGILGVFQNLISSKLNDHEGFFLLESIVQHLPLNVFEQYLPTIWRLLFSRIMQSKTQKFLRSFIIFVSLFVSAHPPDFVVKSIETIQERMFANVIEQVILPNVQTVSGKIERKICAVGLTKLLTQCETVQSQYSPLWLPMLEGNLKLLLGSKEDDNVSDNVEEEELGYKAAFSKLAYGGREDVDPFPDVDGHKFLAIQLHELSKRVPGQVSQSLRPSFFSLLSLFLSLSLSIYHMVVRLAQLILSP